MKLTNPKKAQGLPLNVVIVAALVLIVLVVLVVIFSGRTQKFTEGTEEIEKDFSGWLKDHIDELPVPKEQIQELLKKRMW